MSRHETTMPRLRAPTPGDRFHEMMSAWMLVVWVEDGVLVEHCGGVPRDARRYEYTPSVAEFARRHAYGAMPDKSPWYYCDSAGPTITDAEAFAIITDLAITPDERHWMGVVARL